MELATALGEQQESPLEMRLVVAFPQASLKFTFLSGLRWQGKKKVNSSSCFFLHFVTSDPQMAPIQTSPCTKTGLQHELHNPMLYTTALLELGPNPDFSLPGLPQAHLKGIKTNA